MESRSLSRPDRSRPSLHRSRPRSPAVCIPELDAPSRNYELCSELLTSALSFFESVHSGCIVWTSGACQAITKKPLPSWRRGEARSKESGPEGRRDNIKKQAKNDVSLKKARGNLLKSRNYEKRKVITCPNEYVIVYRLNEVQFYCAISRGHFVVNEFV